MESHDTIWYYILCALGVLPILIPFITKLLSSIRHKHQLFVTTSQHSPAGRGIHNVISCKGCMQTWDMHGCDYYGTSRSLKGEKMNRPLKQKEVAQVLLEYALSQGHITKTYFNELSLRKESNPNEILKMFGL